MSSHNMRRWIAVASIAGLALVVFLTLGHFGIIWFVSPSRERFPIRGIDVSHHQGEIAWSDVASSGMVDFVYIKASEGGDWVDPKFAHHWEATAAVGLPRGAYHFFTLCRPGLVQAEHFMATVPVDPSALPPVIDLEFVGNCAAPPSADILAEVDAFSDLLEHHYGRRPLLYTTEEFYLDILGGTVPSQELWLRDLFGEPSYVPTGWRIWQFHSRARIPGIDGPVDLDAFNGTRAEFEAWRTVAADTSPSASSHRR